MRGIKWFFFFKEKKKGKKGKRNATSSMRTMWGAGRMGREPVGWRGEVQKKKGWECVDLLMVTIANNDN